jgi:bla regulator protein blaR1
MSTRSRLEPGVFGIFRPVLILPEGIADHLTTAQFEAVLAHELCHARRRDNLAAALHMVVEALFWFHPLVWWIRYRLVEERERACDEAVLSAASDPQDYAEGIVAVCRYCLKMPPVCVSGITGSDLKRRVESILVNQGTHRLNFGKRLLLAVAGSSAVVLPLAVGVLHILPARAQETTGDLKFEVATVKPSNPSSGNGTLVDVTPGGRFHAVNATVKDLIETAFDVRSFQIAGGPKWDDAAKYDVEAIPGTLPPAAEDRTKVWTDARFELQALLKDRFQLQLHRAMRTGPVYSLVIAKGGVRLLATQNPQQGINSSQGTMLGEAASMTQLAYKLSRLLQRPVVNNTRLEGNYDFKLEWQPDSDASLADSQRAANDLGPSLFSALQEQLGLRLVATRGPVDFLVIDHVNRPSAN